MSPIMRRPVDPAPSTTSSEPTPEAVFEAIHTVMHRYRAYQYRVLRDGSHDMTHMDGKVLGYFARHPGSTQKDLAQHSGRDKGQLARLIGGLRDRGLLDARPDAADRRNVLLQLTPAGRTVHQALDRQARKLAAQAVATLDEAERRQLYALLQKVDANLGGDA